MRTCQLLPRPSCSPRLLAWLDSLSAYEIRDLESYGFGSLIHMARVNIDWRMLGAALIDWVPSLNLFAFNDMEIGPYLEELARLTGLPRDYSQYFSPKTATPQNWFGIPYLVRPAAAGQDAVVFSLDLLYDLFSGPRSVADSTFARNALMFCLIAEVLFLG